MVQEVFLYDLENSEYKPFNALAVHQRNLNLPIFEVLEYFNDSKIEFNNFDYFHMIEINKIMRNKIGREREYLNGQYQRYVDFKNKYIGFLNHFNDSLLNKYIEAYPKFNADCIVFPQSQSDWLRGGLVDLFKSKLCIPSYEGKKSTDIQLSTVSILPDDFTFELTGLDKKVTKNVLIIDDCKSKGTTMNAIKNTFDTNTKFVEIFYVKSTTKS